MPCSFKFDLVSLVLSIFCHFSAIWHQSTASASMQPQDTTHAQCRGNVDVGTTAMQRDSKLLCHRGSHIQRHAHTGSIAYSLIRSCKVSQADAVDMSQRSCIVGPDVYLLTLPRKIYFFFPFHNHQWPHNWPHALITQVPNFNCYFIRQHFVTSSSELTK